LVRAVQSSLKRRMAWLKAIVRGTVDALISADDDDEDPDETLARALGMTLSANGGGVDEDPYKEIARVDQVVQFFEYEASAVEGFIAADPSFAEELEKKRVRYYNMVNSIYVQHEQIAFLVEELLQLRERLRKDRLGRKATLVEINRVKMDIGDAKNKRFFKDKARKEAMAEIVPMIVKVKTDRLLAEQSYSEKKATHAGVDPTLCANSMAAAGRSGSLSATTGVASDSADGGFGSEATVISRSANPTRRRRPVYTDKELNRLLKDND